MLCPKWMAPALLLTFAAAAAEDGAKIDLTRMILHDGGITMHIIIGLSSIVIFLTIYFLLTLRTAVLMPPHFLTEAEELAGKGDAEGLYGVCLDHKSVAARILGAAARALHENPATDYQLLRDLMEDEGNRQTGGLWQRIQYLMDIAVIAPMFGLLGTVIGMIQAFAGLREAGVKPTILAAGVSKAMITTAGGLVVGIGAMLIYAYFRGHITQLSTQLEENCSLVLQRYVLRRDRQAPTARPTPPPATEARK